MVTEGVIMLVELGLVEPDYIVHQLSDDGRELVGN
jgi:hypothetical protein